MLEVGYGIKIKRMFGKPNTPFNKSYYSAGAASTNTSVLPACICSISAVVKVTNSSEELVAPVTASTLVGS